MEIQHPLVKYERKGSVKPAASGTREWKRQIQSAHRAETETNQSEIGGEKRNTTENKIKKNSNLQWKLLRTQEQKEVPCFKLHMLAVICENSVQLASARKGNQERFRKSHQG